MSRVNVKTSNEIISLDINKKVGIEYHLENPTKKAVADMRRVQSYLKAHGKDSRIVTGTDDKGNYTQAFLMTVANDSSNKAKKSATANKSGGSAKASKKSTRGSNNPQSSSVSHSHSSGAANKSKGAESTSLADLPLKERKSRKAMDVHDLKQFVKDMRHTLDSRYPDMTKEFKDQKAQEYYDSHIVEINNRYGL